MRTTSTPAAIILRSTSRSLLAGPSVATIFVLRCMTVDNASLHTGGALLENGHGGQLLAFEELEEGASRSGRVPDLCGDTELAKRRYRLSAARQRKRRRRGH